MITPKFSITQDDEFVYVSIKVPYIRVSSAELIAEDCTFSFYCKPYLLKLHFPCPLKEEDEECKATYDPFNDNGTLTAHLPKLEHGQFFPDLDLTTKLLQVQSQQPKTDGTAPSIEVISSEDLIDCTIGDDDDEEDTVSELPGVFRSVGDVTYGFNNQYSKVFTNLREELLDMTEIKHPDSILGQYRSVLRIAAENQQFDPERYLGDSMEGEMDAIYQEALALRTFHTAQWDAWKGAKAKRAPVEEAGADLKAEGGGGANVEAVTDGAALTSPAAASPLDPRDIAFDAVGGFSAAEKEILASKLPNKEYLIKPGSDEEFALLLGLADILFAYGYDHRLTTGEGNVESAHTIARLSCTFSWLEDYGYALRGAADSSERSTAAGAAEYREDCVASAIKFSLRRCMIYPYLRVWKLARKVLADVARILFLGKRAILKCLLQLHALFEHTDTHYLLNKIYVADYCVWLQSSALTDAALQSFAKLYNNAKGAVEKSHDEGKGLMGFFLPEIERWAAESEALECEDSDSEETDSSTENEEESSSSGSSDTSDGESDSGTESDTESEDGHASEGGGKEASQSGGEGPEVDLIAATATSGEGLAATEDGLKVRQPVEEEGVDLACRIPAELLDYSVLQQRDPALAYLRPPAGAALTAAAGIGGSADTSAAEESSIGQMLLMPKRKADTEAGVFPQVGAQNKKALIQDITPALPVAPAPSRRVLIEDITPPAAPDAGEVQQSEESLSGVMNDLSISEGSARPSLL
jgi:protein SHQ1